MPDLKCLDLAVSSLKALAAKSAESYVETITTLDGVRKFGIRGEEPAAILNNRFDVYVLQSAGPGRAAILVVDPTDPQLIMVADIGDYSDDSNEQKKYAGTVAAKALQVVPADLHIVPS